MFCFFVLSVMAGASAIAEHDGGVYLVPTVDVPMPSDRLQGDHPSLAESDPSAARTAIQFDTHVPASAGVAERLTAVPGATIQDSGGAGQRKTISLRGASPNAVSVMLDGVLLSPHGSAFDLSRIPMALIGEIEVLRGISSGRYTPAAMGGVVNLVTRKSDRPEVFAQTSYGSFETATMHVGAGASIDHGEILAIAHANRSTGRFTFRYDDQPLTAGNSLQTISRENNQSMSGGAFVRYRTKILGSHIDTFFEGTAEARGLAGPVQNPSPRASQQTARGMASGRLTREFESGGTLQFRSYARSDSIILRGSIFGNEAVRQVDSSIGVEGSYSQLLADRHGLIATVSTGTDWLASSTDQDPSWGRLGIAVRDEVLLWSGNISLVAAARFDLFGRFAVISPKVGAIFRLPSGFSLSLNGGQASRTPSFLELYVKQGTLLPNPNLRPERAVTADAIISWTHPMAGASIAGFWARYEDLISYEYYPPQLAKPFNFQAASFNGLEAEAKFEPTHWLHVSANYGWMQSRNQSDDPRYYGNAVPFRPEHRFAGRFALGVPLAKLQAELIYQSAQFQNRTETRILGERAFFNVGISSIPWKKPQVMISLEAKNILDVHSEDFDGYPLQPRSLFLTVGISLLGESR